MTEPAFKYPRQWILSPSGAAVPCGFVTIHAEAGYCLSANSDASIEIVRCAEQRTIVVYGAAVNISEPKPSINRVAGVLSQIKSDSLADALIDLVGCYVVFVWEDGNCKLYGDPGGVCGIYTRKASNSAASTPALLGKLEPNPSLAEWFCRKPHNNWVPGPKTIFDGIDVVPANHLLRLPEWYVARHWPLDDGQADQSQDETTCRIADDLSSAMRGITFDARPLHVSLTGGYDSRVGLAAMKRYVDQASYFTLVGQGVKTQDAAIARRVATRAGIDLREIECPEPDPELLADYDLLCSKQSRGPRRDVIGGCALVGNGPALHISGGLGELLKNYYSAGLGSRSRPVRLRELLTDFEGPCEAVVESVRHWRQSVAHLSPRFQRTLMYLEQRSPRWMGPADLGSCLFYDTFTPFASRRIAQTAAFAPDQALERGRLHKAVIDRLWPELLDVPFTQGRGPLTRMVPRSVKERARRVKWIVALNRMSRAVASRVS